MARTIINKEEVIDFLELEHPFVDRPSIRGILLAELKLKQTCLGDFYDSLKTDVNDYTTEPEYSPGTYNTGDVVLYRGVYREATQTTTKEPNFSSAWRDAPKFSNAGYTDLWENGLGLLFASVVMLHSLPLIVTKLRSTGAKKLQTGTAQAAPDINTEDLGHYFADQATAALEVVRHQLEANPLPGSDSVINSDATHCTCNKTELAEINAMERLFYGQIKTSHVGQCSYCQNRWSQSPYGVY
jgi:hypothetical protein